MTITAQLLQNGSFGNPISYQSVDFFDETCDMHLGSVETDVDGYASLEWMVALNHPLGMTILNVTYHGNDSLNLWPSFQQASVIVLSRTELYVEVEEESLSPGDKLEIIVRLNNDLGIYIAKEKVSVVHGETLLAETLTNGTGFAIFSIECNSSWSTIGSDVVQIVYAGNWTSFSANATRTIGFVVTKIPTSLELYDIDQSVLYLNESATMRIISMADKEILPSVQLGTTLDNSEFTYFHTNQSGIGILTFLADSSINIGYHTLIVEYGGNERFESSKLEIEISVVSDIKFDVTLTDSFVIDSIAYVEVRLFDYFHRNLTDLTVSLIDNVVNESTTLTTSSGENYVRFSIWVIAPKGSRTLMLVVGGSPFIRSSNYSIKLDIWVRPNIIMIESTVDGYAYPGQIVELKLLIRSRVNECPNRIVGYSLDNGLSYSTGITDDYGLLSLTVSMPMYECEYAVNIVYNGSDRDYERPSSMRYVFTVTRRIPVVVSLLNQDIVTPLQKIHVSLLVMGMNGTRFGNITLVYGWLDIEERTSSSHIGVVDLILSIPYSAGIHNISYRIEESRFLSLSVGEIGIVIRATEIMSSQGAGISVIASSLSVSLGFLAVPPLRRRYLVG
ncbi:MAG: hypothetical protein ACW99U_01340 [Candidatus Thorarchaeota archaeon]